MSEMVVIPCGSRKITTDTPVRACDLYRGNFFITHKNYANHFYSDWCILSAKYGILYKNDLVLPYNISFKSTDSVGVDYIKQQIKAINPTKITAITSIFYHDILTKSFDGELYNPFISHFAPPLNNGNQQKFLKSCIAANLHASEFIDNGLYSQCPSASNDLVYNFILFNWPCSEITLRDKFRCLFSCSNMRFKKNYEKVKFDIGASADDSHLSYFAKQINIESDINAEIKFRASWA